VTAVCAFLEAGEHRGLRLTLCVAGHPPPLVLGPSGDVARVAGHGSLLGVWDDLALEEQVIDLMPGHRLVLYTDGVIEAGAPTMSSARTAWRGCSAPWDRLPAEAAAAIEAAVLAEDGVLQRDDVAVLVVAPEDERAA
jgi:hypothetical protein